MHVYWARQPLAGFAVRPVSSLRRVPVRKLLVAGEVALLIRDHVMWLAPHDRHRLVELVRVGVRPRRNLSAAERDELAALIAKMEPRLLAGEAVVRIFRLQPRRLLYGSRRRR